MSEKPGPDAGDTPSQLGQSSAPGEGDAPSGGRRAVANVASLLTSNVVNRATSFIVYAAVGRFMGADDLGQLALAMTFLLLLNRFVMVGIQTHTTREIAKDPSLTGPYLINGTAIIAATSIVGYAAAYLLVELLGYQSSTARVVMVLMVGLGPYSISQLAESVLLARQKASYVAAIDSPIHIIQTTVAVVLIQRDFSIEAITWSIVVAYAAMALLKVVVLVRIVGRRTLSLSVSLAQDMVKMGATFLGIQAVNGLHASVDVIVISRVLGETEVGIFAAARQLLVPILLISQSVGWGLFPSMVQSYRSGLDRLRRVVGQVMELMMVIVVPAVVGAAALAGPLLELIYGTETFQESEIVLRILVWTAVAGAATAVLGQALWAVGREKVTLRIVIINVALKAILAGALIPLYGVTGAAVGAVLVGAVNVAQHYFPVAAIFGRIPVLAPLWKPVVAVLVMLGSLLLTESFPIVTRILAAAVAYVAVVGGLLALTGGGWKRLRGDWA